MKKRHLDALIVAFMLTSLVAALVRIFLIRTGPTRNVEQLLVITRVSLILVSALLVIMSRFLVFLSGLMSFPTLLRGFLAVFLLVLGLAIQVIGFVFSLWAGDWLEHMPFLAIGLYQILRFRGPILRMMNPEPHPLR
jgi:hypothetical protein